MFSAKCSDSIQPIQNITYASKNSPNTQADLPLHLLSIIRPHTVRRPKPKQYQSSNEFIMQDSNKLRTSNKTPSSQLDKDVVHVNSKVKRQCGYCGLRGDHRYDGGCKLMSETGYLLKKRMQIISISNSPNMTMTLGQECSLILTVAQT